MGMDDGRSGLPENYNRRGHDHRGKEVAGVDKISISGPLTNIQNLRTGDRKLVEFNILDGAPGSSTGSVKSNGNDDYIEITLDICDDSVAVVQSVKTADGVDVEDPELGLLGKGLGTRSWFGSSTALSASERIRQNTQELKRFSKRQRRLDRTESAASDALKGLRFISKSDSGATWRDVEQRFNGLTEETNGLLPRALFGKCIGMDKDSKDGRRKDKEKTEVEGSKKDSDDDFPERLFDALCRRRNITRERIDKSLLHEFWDQISDQSFDSRLTTFLDMVDKDTDGRITEEEIKEIISLSASANKLSIIQNQADEYAASIMEELDPDNLGYIMIENLEMLLLQAPTHNVRGESRNLSQMLSQKLKTTHHGNLIRRWYEDFKYFLQDNWQRCWVIVLWIGIMACMFVWKYIQYRHRAVYDVLGSCVCIAKGAAETLKLNMAIILLPVCRNTITWLRNNTKLDVVVPFNDNLNFHQVIAVAIAIGVGLHAISHLACDFPRLIHATEEEYKPMQQYFGDQATSYWHFVKEVEVYTGIIMVVLMTIVFTLAWLREGKLKPPSVFDKLKRFNAFKNSKQYSAFVTKLTGFYASLNKLTGFNVFWYSHHLFVVVYVMLIVHGIKLYLTKEWYKKTTWMYLAVPVSLYACERLTRALRSRIQQVEILKVAVYPGNVFALHMSKPQGFKYKSGQYIFVNCAAVSPFEWHPFSITSAPGDDYLSVHIRADGDWTGKLKTTFLEKYSLKEKGKGGNHSVDFQEGDKCIIKVKIDGPYGAPAQDYKKYDIVLLLGLGIGATPMISIVKDILNNLKAQEEEENALENGEILQKNKVSPTNANEFKTKHAYFYWVTGQQGTFDWFKEVMNEVAEMDKNGVIEMHNYCTSVYEEGDVRSAIITMLQSLNHAKNGVDVVSGTRVKSHFGRPVWQDVYKEIAVNHIGRRIGVFYCGPAPAIQDLKPIALEFSHALSTKFEFHKENF